MSSPTVATNTLKHTLRNGGSAVGTMLIEFRQPPVMHLLARAGFDFVLIDGEHGPFNIETIADLCRTARLVGITPIVRVPEPTYAHITQPLDAGAQGIMLPRVVRKEDVIEALQLMKYPPTGRRGAVLTRGHTDFRGGALSETLVAMNDETMLVVQVETRQAVENVNEIVSVDGVDVALIGPTDLSLALGVPGKLDDPSVTAAVNATVEACKRYSVTPAIHMNDLARGVEWAKRGMRMVSLNSEVGFMIQAGSQASEAVRKALEG